MAVRKCPVSEEALKDLLRYHYFHRHRFGMGRVEYPDDLQLHSMDFNPLYQVFMLVLSSNTWQDECDMTFHIERDPQTGEFVHRFEEKRKR